MNLQKLLTIFFLSVFIYSCNKTDKTSKTNNLFKFKDYINYTTSGEVSASEPIKIGLAKVVDSWSVNKEITDKIITISPSVKGKIIALNTRTFIFQPSNKLDSNKEYKVTVHLSKIYNNVPQNFKNYTFKFKTVEQNFKITAKNFQSYSKEWQYIKGAVQLADYITLNEVKTIITAVQKNKKLSVKWENNDSIAKQFQFIIDSVQRFENESKVTLHWDGSAINVDNKGESQLKVVGKNNFSVISIHVFQSPEQHLSINFSDPLKRQQNFKGLVAIQKAKNLKYVVEGNILKVYPSSRITGNVAVTVFQGIKNTENYKLKNTYTESITFEQLKPAIRLLSSGVILPTSNNLKINFEAVNLKAVDIRVIKIFENNVLQFLQENNLGSTSSYNLRRVGRRVAKKTITLVNNGIEDNGKWKAYAIDLSKMIKSDPGAIYRVELTMKQSYSLYKCDTSDSTTSTENNYEDEYNSQANISEEDSDILEEEYWDNLIYSYNDYYYSWNDRNNPCKEAYYLNSDKIVATNILASNLGVIVKKGINKSYFFIVTDLLTTKPVSNAEVTLYNYQQQEIAKAVTDKEGITGLDMDKNAYFAIVSKDNHKTYIKLDDGYSLSLSKFNVSGKKLQKGLKGFIYGERGVWRPGDSIHLTFVLNDNNNPLPPNHPVKLEVLDARGKLAFKQVKTDNLNGFYSFIIPTSGTDPTGNWNSTISVGGAKFYKQLKIETVKPNRLKIKIDFDKEVLTNKSPIIGNLNVKWLHGAIAKNLKAEVDASFTVHKSAFKKQYPKYIFIDPTSAFYPKEESIFRGKLDSEGNAKIYKKINFDKNAPGMLKATFLTKAFEKGGDFSMDVITKNYAPYNSFVGLRTPKTKVYDSYDTDNNVSFDVVTVTATGKPLPRKKVRVELYQIKWRWWWSSSYDNLSSYSQSSYKKPYKELNLTTNSSGKRTFTLNIPEKDGGRFLMKIIDLESGHTTGKTMYFYKNWWKSPSNNPEASKMLVFSSNKEKYNVGEKAIITFPSGAQGHALISVENGTEVLQTFWKKTTKGETKIEVALTKEMTPNVYINISLLQPHASTKNDLPLRLYGVIPLMVENPKTRLEPKITLPKTLKPEETFAIKVSEKNNKAMTYTIAVVEEGLLDLTRYKTPNIWNAFYSKEALGVKTWDVFDNVIGAFGGSIEQVFAIGGDADIKSKKNKKANLFKPVVRCLGPFNLQKGKTATHKVRLPKYIGSVRTMIVAGDKSNAAYGKAEVTTPVRKPLMVLASLPRKLSPGEKVTLPVTIFAMEPSIKNVKVHLKLTNGIKIIGATTQKITFSNPDEKMVYFDLDVSEAKGVGKIQVIASGNGEKSTYEVEIAVFNPNPISTKSTTVELQPNSTQKITFSTFGIKGSNQAEIEFSTLPPMDFSRRVKYLIQYPHGCVEQTTSSAFPQLYLTDILDLPLQKKQEITKNIKSAIEKLGDFQTPSGGLSYWMGLSQPDDWGTSYAGHFMIEAQKKGYVLPLTFMTNWLKYQKQQARNWRPSYRSYNSDLAQAYRLYTLALAGYPDLSAMNRLREFNEISNNAKWRLAAAYALAGQKEVAKNIASVSNIHFKSKHNDYYTYGSVDRNRAMAMETMLLIGDKQATDLAKYIANKLSSNAWMSTQTTAYSLLAMAKMVAINGGKSIKLQYKLNNGSVKNITTNRFIVQRKLTVSEGNNAITLTNNKSNKVFVNIINSGILPLGEEVVEKRGLQLNVMYKDTDDKKIDVSTLSQGTEFTAYVTVSNLNHERVTNIALTELFPSGWEIINTRFTNFGSAISSANYTDIRDDRVNYYFDLEPQQSKTFKILLNASFLGKYYLYGVQAEAMYNNNYFVRTKGKWIEVIK